eukprot:3479615-Rhodomonas_salina.7
MNSLCYMPGCTGNEGLDDRVGGGKRIRETEKQRERARVGEKQKDSCCIMTKKRPWDDAGGRDSVTALNGRQS